MEEFTDDCRVTINNGSGHEELALDIFKMIENSIEDSVLYSTIQQKYLLSEDDLYFAVERVYGGIIRGVTKNKFNEPKREKDPLAYHSFHKVLESYQESKKKWWDVFSKNPENKWDLWVNDRMG
jgi:hypothetical protein